MSAQAIHDTHQRLFGLILKHGTEAEKAQVQETLAQMRELREAFPEGNWEPMEQVEIPGFLIAKCRRVAKERQDRAKRFSLENKHGVRRTFDEELRSVEAQTACALILGLPLFAVRNHAAGRHGNVAENISAFCPRPGSFQLIIGEKEPPQRQFFLMHLEGTDTFKCVGWIRAGLGQHDEFQKTYTRDDGNGNVAVSRPYVVPTDMLSPVREWFESRA